MKLISSIVFAVALLSTQSFAIFGFGGHWGPAMGFKTTSGDDALITLGGFDVLSLKNNAAESLSGAGVKFWVDVLPIIDIEATLNMQLSRYSVTLYNDSISQALEVDLGLPFVPKASPAFVNVVGDLSVTYPYDILDLPLINFKVYGGGGLTYFYNTKVLNAKFAKSALEGTNLETELAAAVTAGNGIDETATKIASALVEEMASNGLQSGVGGHVLVGTRFELAVIAVYANAKWYIGGGLDDAVDTRGTTVEIGAGMAF